MRGNVYDSCLEVNLNLNLISPKRISNPWAKTWDTKVFKIQLKFNGGRSTERSRLRKSTDSVATNVLNVSN